MQHRGAINARMRLDGSPGGVQFTLLCLDKEKKEKKEKKERKKREKDRKGEEKKEKKKEKE